MLVPYGTYQEIAVRAIERRLVHKVPTTHCIY
jgi:hypothetical protein